MPDPVNLSAVFGLPPEKAIEYFQAKGYAIAWDWHEVWQEAQARAFTVAKVMRADILEDIRGELQRGFEQGMTEAEFIRNLKPRLIAKGWWGQVINEETGEIGQGGSPRRLKTIFRTNLQTGYMAGRYRAMMENTGSQPGARNWWMYVAVMDGRTRPTHAALNNRVFRFDDPLWRHYYPPNGFNCRCRIRALTDGDLAREGIAPSSSAGYLGETEVTDPRSGITRPVATLKLPGMDKTFSPDLGWSYNPGAAAFGNDVEMMRKISAVKDRSVRVQAVQALNNSALRRGQFAGWVDKVMAARAPQGAAQTVGLMDEDVAGFVRGKGLEPARVITVTDRSLLHADREKHAGATLTADEYRALPGLLADPEAVLWDVRHANLLYIGPSGTDERKNKVIISLAYALRKKGVVDEIINAYKVGENALEDAKSYELVKGKLKP